MCRLSRLALHPIGAYLKLMQRREAKYSCDRESFLIFLSDLFFFLAFERVLNPCHVALRELIGPLKREPNPFENAVLNY